MHLASEAVNRFLRRKNVSEMGVTDDVLLKYCVHVFVRENKEIVCTLLYAFSTATGPADLSLLVINYVKCKWCHLN